VFQEKDHSSCFRYGEKGETTTVKTNYEKSSYVVNSAKHTICAYTPPTSPGGGLDTHTGKPPAGGLGGKKRCKEKKSRTN
jgi:hypothetical protein